jgi:hypothetical protein
LGNARIDGGPVWGSVAGRQHTHGVGRTGQGLADGQPDTAAPEIERKDDFARRRARASGWRG